MSEPLPERNIVREAREAAELAAMAKRWPFKPPPKFPPSEHGRETRSVPASDLRPLEDEHANRGPADPGFEQIEGRLDAARQAAQVMGLLGSQLTPFEITVLRLKVGTSHPSDAEIARQLGATPKQVERVWQRMRRLASQDVNG